ncbi:hypothetical protein PPL_07661 [Heterostelium album PN500]|uniref:Multifunctional methyltransferase subunit TRM112-like protein n=1 Tax=Heterostelium pallidum (strain ATCC 26659 / Pp 5 / PN500) TaxID=670386 RepID=D3BGK9_HETP5|nr:hypothetical protein PPL_07661 [Heterostelium album PN500]EFA79243.1 hypothetical protein PPL_07661 [Heterostelium album PN500]|eukprot:XP_020431364.1 hypothetical protein PPL_07661 [Heterostelium album PN500]
MKILTHNMMACTKRQCVGRGFPLLLEVKDVSKLEQEFNVEFTKNIFPKLDWKGITMVAAQFNLNLGPITEKSIEDEEFLKNLYNLLCNVKVMTGQLTCPNCQRVYPIDQGIPNMLLKEDEIYQDIQPEQQQQ